MDIFHSYTNVKKMLFSVFNCYPTQLPSVTLLIACVKFYKCEMGFCAASVLQKLILLLTDGISCSFYFTKNNITPYLRLLQKGMCNVQFKAQNKAYELFNKLARHALNYVFPKSY